ncbi:MAG: HD domain-containing protein [Promethearchaeota archaeon]
MNSSISPNHILTQVRNFAKDFYDEADDLHGWGHITRVLKISKNLAKFYSVDHQTLEMGVLLHDIGRKEEKIKKMHHAELSVELSTPFLQSLGLGERIISDVAHIIRSHSFSLKISPEIIEAKILSDADKLDALGAVGIYRECAFQALHGGKIANVIQHCHDKLFKLEELLLLPPSKELGQKLTKRVRDFQEQLQAEISI